MRLLKNLGMWKKGQRLDEVSISHVEPYGMMIVKGDTIYIIKKQI